MKHCREKLVQMDDATNWWSVPNWTGIWPWKIWLWTGTICSSKMHFPTQIERLLQTFQFNPFLVPSASKNWKDLFNQQWLRFKGAFSSGVQVRCRSMYKDAPDTLSYKCSVWRWPFSLQIVQESRYPIESSRFCFSAPRPSCRIGTHAVCSCLPGMLQTGGMVVQHQGSQNCVELSFSL